MLKISDRIIEKAILIFIFFLPICSPISVIAVIFAIISFLILHKKKPELPPSVFWISMSILLFFTFLSALFSIDRRISFSRFPFYLASFLLCFILSRRVASREGILKAFILSGLVVTCFGIIQHITNFNMKISTDFFSMTFSTKGGISSTFSNPNRFAQYLVLLLPLVFVSLSILKGTKWKMTSVFLLFTSFGCLCLSKSFAGIGAVSILILLTIFLKNWRIGILVLILSVVIIGLNRRGVEDFSNRFTNTSSMEIRLSTWKVALSGFKKNPVTGSGLSTFQKVAAQYEGDEKIMHGHAHSMYIQLLSETGLLGLFAFLFVMGIFLHHTLVNKSALSYGSALSIIGVLLAGVTGTILEFLPLALLFWTIIGIGVGEHDENTLS